MAGTQTEGLQLVGTHVQIKRSDGRIHPALVTSFNIHTDDVTVNWIEKNETKGKEILLEDLVALNPQVIIKPEPDEIKTEEEEYEEEGGFEDLEDEDEEKEDEEGDYLTIKSVKEEGDYSTTKSVKDQSTQFPCKTDQSTQWNSEQ